MSFVRAALSIEGVTDALPPPVTIDASLQLRLAFTDVAGAAIATSGVTLKIARPDGVELEVLASAMEVGGTGVWLYATPLDQPGQWRFRGGSADASTADLPVTVTGSALAPPLPTGPILVDEVGLPLVLPDGGLLTLARVDHLPEATVVAGLSIVALSAGQAKRVAWETIEAAAGEAGSDAGVTGGTTAGAAAGAAAGATAGATAGAAAGTTAGAASAAPFATAAAASATASSASASTSSTQAGVATTQAAGAATSATTASTGAATATVKAAEAVTSRDGAVASAATATYAATQTTTDAAAALASKVSAATDASTATTARIASQAAQTSAESAATSSGASATTAQGFRDGAATSKSAAEAAFAIAAGGYAGPLITAGGYHLTTILYSSTNAIAAGIDVNGRFVAWDGTTFGPVSPMTYAGVIATLGFVPASAVTVADIAAASGFAGPLVRVGGFDMIRVVYDPTTRAVVGGTTIDGLSIGVVSGVLTALGVTPITVGNITAALGYTAADAADVTSLASVAGFTGPLIRAGNFDLVRVIYDPTTLRVVGGTTVAGEPVGVVEGLFALLGTGGSAIVANPAPAYSYEANTGSLLIVDDSVIYMILGWGQSLAVAELGSYPGDVSRSSTALHAGFSLMLDSVWPRSGAITQISNLANPTGQETAGPLMFDVIQSKLLARIGRKQKLLWTVAGAGGALYRVIKRGTLVWTEMLTAAAQAAALAKLQGKRLVIPGIYVRHGEADVYRHPDAYASDLIALRHDADEDLRRITGQVEQVRLFLTQPTRGSSVAAIDQGTPAGMLLAADRDPLCRVWGPIYYAFHDATYDTAHPNSVGYADIAATAGYAALDELFGEGFTAVRIQETYWVTGGAAPVLELRYARPVVIDTSGAAVSPTGVVAAGFDILDGSTAVAISSAAVVAPVMALSIAGNVVTFSNVAGTATDTTTVKTSGEAGPVGVTVTVDGIRYDVWGDISDFLTEVAEKLRALIPGATRSGRVVTVPGATTITGAVATSFLRLTLASVPALRPRLLYACKATGSGAGTPMGARGLVREWRRLGINAPTSTPLHHWACVEARSIPKL